MFINPCHLGLSVPLCHTQELPAIPLVKPDMVRHEVKRRNPFRAHIVHGQVQERPGDSLPAKILLRDSESTSDKQEKLPFYLVLTSDVSK